MPRPRMGDVVVLLPGLTGSVLRKDGKDLWGPSAGALLKAALGGSGRLRSLVLRDDPPERDSLGDGVTATRLFPDVHLIPGLWKIDGYSRIGATLKQAFGLVEGRNYFELPYDWRRDNRVAGRQLARKAHEWLAAWRTSSGNAEARLVLVVHSMGGLVARAFLELHDGWRITRALVTFGTPFRGSLSALDALCNGVRKGPLGMVDLTALTRSCTSVHQLLPVYPVVDSGSGRLVRVNEGDAPPGLDRERAASGLRFHEEIRRAAEDHAGAGEYRDRGYAVFPVVGLGQETWQSAAVRGSRLEMLASYAGEDLSGDGTVPRVSATPLERGGEHREMYTGTRHAALQSTEATLTHLVGVVSSLSLDLDAYRLGRAPAPKRRATRLRGPIALEIGDLYWRGEPVLVRARPSAAGVRLRASVRPAAGGAVVARATLRTGPDGWHAAELRPLPAGSWRVTVAGGPSLEPVEDVIAVAEGRPS
jgi:pimeloyl-ACP methyl ester carboxylesterase